MDDCADARMLLIDHPVFDGVDRDAAGLDVGVNIAPMIPGLGDEDMPQTLEAAAAAGASHAGFVFLRLPGPVKQVFEERLRAAMPMRADKILNRIRDARGGLVCEDGFGDHYPVCTLSPREGGRMRIDIVNRGAVWTKVQILSN